MLKESREAVAKYLNADAQTCVLVTNTTTALNTVLRGLVFNPGDVIIYPSTTYGAVEKLIEYIKETTPAESRKLEYTYPVSDARMCSMFEAAIQEIRAEGKNPKIAIFDTIVSVPGVRMPFERLTELCRSHGVLSCIDGAHSIGQIDINLAKLDPDFYASNCHKWLLVPRGCAVFYVPLRNQHLIRSTVPTSHGFMPKGDTGIYNPLPRKENNTFVNNFIFFGTADSTPFVCIPAALKWRSKVTFQDKRGEDAVKGYCQQLARTAGRVVSEILATNVLENDDQTLGNCVLTNVRLPLLWDELTHGDPSVAEQIRQWIELVLVGEYNTFMAIFVHGGQWWVRLSAQIYLTIEDFEWAGQTLKAVCERVRNSEWKTRM